MNLGEDNNLGSMMPLTAKDYIQDGLIYQLDGIENDGYGVEHKASCPWRDCVSGKTVTGSTASGSGAIGQFNSDHLVIPANHNTYLFYAMTDAIKDACAKGFITIEFRGRHSYAKATAETSLLDIYVGDPTQYIYNIQCPSNGTLYTRVGTVAAAKPTSEDMPHDSEGL